MRSRVRLLRQRASARAEWQEWDEQQGRTKDTLARATRGGGGRRRRGRAPFVPFHVDGARRLENSGRDEVAVAALGHHDVAGVRRVERGRGRLEEEDVRHPNELRTHPHVLNPAVLTLERVIWNVKIVSVEILCHSNSHNSFTHVIPSELCVHPV